MTWTDSGHDVYFYGEMFSISMVATIKNEFVTIRNTDNNLI